MKLVMVHGRSQEGKDPVALKKEWLDALTYGLARAGASVPDDLEVAFPYYGDLLAGLVEEVNTPLGRQVNAKGPNPDASADADLRGQIFQELAERAQLDDADIRREVDDVATEKGPGNWEWVQGALRALDRIPGLNTKVIDAFTRDVFVYLTFRGVRRKIDAVVQEALGDGPCVVLAHSLGTVVTYNVLYNRAASPAYPRLVTVGSPLGIRAIKSKIDAPLKSPPGVGHWFNAYDDRDLVALAPLDERTFGVTPAIENKSDVQNFTENRHGIAGYLADPVVAARIAEFLQGP